MRLQVGRRSASSRSGGCGARSGVLVLCLVLGSPAIGLADPPEVPAFAREMSQRPLGIARAGIQRQGPHRVLHLSPRPQVRGPGPRLHRQRRHDPHLRAGVGWAGTADEFADYHLIVEWKWGEKTWPPRRENARDSGILLHCVGPRRRRRRALDGVAWSARSSRGAAATCSWSAAGTSRSLTCEIRTGPDGQPYYEKGGKPVTRDSGRFNWWGRDPEWKDVLGFRGKRDVEKPAGQWNRMEVDLRRRHRSPTSSTARSSTSAPSRA